MATCICHYVMVAVIAAMVLTMMIGAVAFAYQALRTIYIRSGLRKLLYPKMPKPLDPNLLSDQFRQMIGLPARY